VLVPVKVDVVIVGGGPAGSAVALRLARAGCAVALVERSCFERPRIGETLPPAVQPLLADLGVWGAFASIGAVPSFGTRSLWGDEQPADHAHLVTPYLTGWHVDRVRFDRLLVAAAADAGASVLLGARVADVEAHSGRLAVGLATGPRTALEARMVVDATGRAAVVGRRLGAERAVFDRLVGTASALVDDHDRAGGYTLVEATPAGWWYSAPAGSGRIVATLMTDADLAKPGTLHDAGSWRKALALAPCTRTRVGRRTAEWGPRLFAATSQRVVRRPNGSWSWLAVGDAALAVDPISGSGVVRALRTAAAGSTALLAALDGDREAIAEYDAAGEGLCRTYLRERASYYGAERRWPLAPFWHRRAAVHYT
jgi:flavin-dependent dehydrogenase